VRGLSWKVALGSLGPLAVTKRFVGGDVVERYGG
jgi:hypothetical protein